VCLLVVVRVPRTWWEGSEQAWHRRCIPTFYSTQHEHARLCRDRQGERLTRSMSPTIPAIGTQGETKLNGRDGASRRGDGLDNDFSGLRLHVVIVALVVGGVVGFLHTFED